MNSTRDALRQMYASGHPNSRARFMNRIGALVFSLGFSPHYAVALETRNPKSDKALRIPIVVTPYAGNEYVVSMLGQHSYWVRNVRAARGRATIVSGRRRAVILEEVPAKERAPILKAYLGRAPGARPHIPINCDAPVASFEALASDYPVFEIRYCKFKGLPHPVRVRALHSISPRADEHDDVVTR